MTMEWPGNPEETQFLLTQHNVQQKRREDDKDKMESQINIRRYSFFKEQLTNMFVSSIIIGLIWAIVTPLIETGGWRPPNFGNVLFDIFIFAELATFLYLFYMGYICFGTFISVTIDNEHVHLHGKLSGPMVISFDNISYFEVSSLNMEETDKSKSSGIIVSINLESGKRIILRTPPSIFFNSCRKAMEIDLINSTKAPKRLSNPQK